MKFSSVFFVVADQQVAVCPGYSPARYRPVTPAGDRDVASRPRSTLHTRQAGMLVTPGRAPANRGGIAIADGTMQLDLYRFPPS